MAWYACCDNGHHYWAGPNENEYNDAKSDANHHDQSAHGGVETAVILLNDDSTLSSETPGE